MVKYITSKFVGHYKYSNNSKFWAHEATSINPSLVNSLYNIQYFGVDGYKYYYQMLNKGYYYTPMTSNSLISKLALRLIKNWHRLKDRICISLSYSDQGTINGRFNIIRYRPDITEIFGITDSHNYKLNCE